MSTQFRTSLLAASAIVAAAATPAHAQLIYPAAQLHGSGASSIQDIFPREANCIGDYNASTTAPIRNNSFNVPSGTTAFAPRSAVATAGGTAKFDCAVANIQPNITVKYVSIGSGGGRNGLVAATAAASGTAIFGANTRPDATIFGTDTTTWTMPHFAFSDAPLTAANVSTWNASRNSDQATVGKGAGALIQIPLYVLPIAIAYSPVYGYKEGTTPGTFDKKLTLNVKAPGGVLRLSKHAYCGIFNGYITNWNNAEIQRSNYINTKPGTVAPVGAPLFDTANDDASRWASEGAPIRLVGRLDASGSTDIFTRHLAAGCSSSIMQLLGPQKISRAAESLPYNPSSGIDMTTGTGSLATSRFLPTGAGTNFANFAGDLTLISGAAYAGSSGIVKVSGTGEVVTASSSGTNGSGLYILANGGGNVAAAIADATVDRPGVLIASADGSIKFNGKIGYVSNDTVVANPGLGLKAAALETGNTYNKGRGKLWVFSQPSAKNATAAFGNINPPESDAKGNYVAGGDLLRSNPLNWYDALYADLSTLANPAKGYPMTGTTQFITGTCFADPATRNAVVTLLRTMLGVNLIDKTGKQFDPVLFKGTTASAGSLRVQNGLAQLPAAWVNAINATFLQRSTKFPALGAKRLYIQNGQPNETYKSPTVVAKGSVLSAADLAAIPASRSGGPNPNCKAGEGIPAL